MTETFLICALMATSSLLLAYLCEPFKKKSNEQPNLADNLFLTHNGDYQTMKTLGIRCVIGKDLHELYEIEPGDDWSQFPWRCDYGAYGENFQIDRVDHPENWYWVPVPWGHQYKEMGSRITNDEWVDKVDIEKPC